MTETAPRIGWIGVGRMGEELVKRLRSAGYPVTVYNRTRAKAERLIDIGVDIVSRPVDLVDCDIVVSMVATSADFEEVMLGASGVLTDSTRAPGAIADASTISTEASQAVRSVAEARGVGFLATPVSGNPRVIAAGKLTTVASGPRAVFDAVKPVLASWGRAVVYVGEGDLARTVKIAHNVFLGVVTQSLAEVTVLAEQAGVPRHAFLEFLNDSVMGSVFTRYKTPALVNLDFTPTFTTALLRKDLDLGLAAADRLGVAMPVARLSRELVAQESDAGAADLDFASIILAIARSSGVDIRPEHAAVTDGLED
ncbi:MAG: NAD(P)-dependent oxidoreductase [Microbacterium sp.]|uniref:NAD(P)-dependent oxidoreductase n=1 Tax=Microbacterium sp. TaxID=51671 RepID=UPI003F8159D3